MVFASWKRAGIRFIAAALDPRWASYLVLGLIGLHVVAWTIILTIAGLGGTLNSDTTEMYAWGRLWLWGYGKHPPLAGWIAGIWFDVFPTADWAMYALAMAVVGVAAWASWMLASRVVDRRRAILVLLLLLIYPVFTFRGSRYGTDLPQVPLFVLVVLAFVIAFEARTIGWGIVLGLACAGAVLTKYWALFVVGAVGLAAIAHPERARFFRSWTPYVAAIVFGAAVAPHLLWLVQSDYAPFAYAAHHLEPRPYGPLAQAGSELRHHFGLLLPVGLALVWAVTRPRLQPPENPGRCGVAFLDGKPVPTFPENAPTVRLDRARHIWLIAGVLVVLPPIMTVAFGVYFAVDWGTPLYVLLPLAAVAVPWIGVGRRALIRTATLWAVLLAVGLILAPVFQVVGIRVEPDRFRQNQPDVAAQVTRLWRERYGTPLPVIAGPKLITAGIAFYSDDHPVLFTNLDPRIATWIDLKALRRSGFVVVCPEQHAPLCEALLRAIGFSAEPLVISQAPNRFDPSASALRWSVYLVQPQ